MQPSPESRMTARRAVYLGLQAAATGIVNLDQQRSIYMANAQDEHSFLSKLAASLKASPRSPWLHQVVSEVFFDLQAKGLIVPEHQNAHVLGCTFTYAGLEFFKSRAMVLVDPNLVACQLRDQPAEVQVVAQEAWRCLTSGCNRAAMVMVGLAAEDSAAALIEALCGIKGHEKQPYWKPVTSESGSFQVRWTAGLQMLDRIKERLKAQRQGRVEWWSRWECVPDVLRPIGEALRLGRNRAAHSIDDEFSFNHVAMYYASLPFYLKTLDAIREFLDEPPDGIALA